MDRFVLFFKRGGLDLYLFGSSFYSLYITSLSVILIFFASAFGLEPFLQKHLGAIFLTDTIRAKAKVN